MRSIRSPYDGRVVGEVPVSTLADADAALSAAAAAFPITRRLPAHVRHDVLQCVAQSLRLDRESFARTIVAEAGKPIRDARVEVDRAALVFSLAADEARRQGGELIPLDLNAASEGRLGLTRRFPLGPVGAITPFNFPLNLVAHKLAPAIAIGAPVVLKPAEKTPLSAIRLVRLALDHGWRPDALHVLTPETPAEIGAMLASDPRAPVFSFTGADSVGWRLKAQANRKKVTLELGGNATAIVCADADLPFAIARCVVGAFANAGQVCISVQRILVERSVFGDFVAGFVDAVRALTVGDPDDEATQVGPMITAAAADTVEAKVEAALSDGATPLLRGRRLGNTLLAPTVLTSTSPNMAVIADELFGPVVAVEAFDAYDDAVAAVNASRFGLQAGVFTRDIGRALSAFEELSVGGVLINDTPQYRIDHMPYGGEKDSGFGREGVRYAIEELTALRLLVLNRG